MALSLIPLMVSAAPCAAYTRASQTPAGYAPPVSWYTNTLLLNADCTGTQATLTVGDNSPTTYVYDTAYYHTGTSWVPLTLTGTGKQGRWIPRKATASFTLPQPTTYVAAYTCEWQGNTWRCGCTTPACTQRAWQLQRVRSFDGGASAEETAARAGEGSVGARAEGAALCYAGKTKERQYVATPEALRTALRTASCGQEIVVGPGEYGGAYTWGKVCPANAPVVVRAARPRASMVTGTITLGGAYAVWEGFTFLNPARISVKGKGMRITRNLFRGTGKSIQVDKTARDTRIDHNEFVDTFGGEAQCKGSYVVACSDIVLNVRKDDRPLRTLIDRNYFHTTVSTLRQGNAIYVGTFDVPGDTRTDTVIENNVFQNWWKKGVVHIKSDGTTFRSNVVQGGFARVDVRQGSFNLFKDNRMERTQEKMYLRDSYNTAEGNYVPVGIRLMAGSGWEGRENTYKAAHNTVLKNNEGPVTVGFMWRGTTLYEIPRNITIIGQRGTVQKVAGRYDPATYREDPTPTGPVRGKALSLAPRDVGVSARDARCSR